MANSTEEICTATDSDHFFLIVMSCVIFLMQMGFAFLEAGSVRAKNTTNILLKNMLDVCIGAVAYWAIGYAFAFGKQANAFIGYRYFFFESLPACLYSHFFFHFVFAATAATIVSGAMAERTEFMAYFVYSSAITGFIYPVVVHWAWSSEGWLANGPSGLAYQDFAGSGVVHCVGGAAALVGAAILGPRIGRYDENGKPKEISGHTVPMVALGGFILFFGFFAFNGGSQASISTEGDGTTVSLAVVNTIISGACGALVALVIKRIGFSGSYWSLLTTINGGLTGMVAICAGCDAVYPWGAAIIGAVAGAAYMMWSSMMVSVRVDDPLDAIAVHLGGGLWGVLAVPLFDMNDGIVFTFSKTAWQSFGWNLLGVFVITSWTSVLSLVLFGLMQACGILRVSPEMEMKGLDIPKHGEPAYPLESYGHGWAESNQDNGVNGHPLGQVQEYTNSAFEGAVAIDNPSYTDKGDGNDLPL
ncbi:putative ammonium transporter 1 [Lytechinus pictus]|uniref:putative ammonium transporter 1 n=1 Tax=Lytechinus pictus TaxID=7653 RepID=UPI0030B9F8E1